jgi:hypothetical protein
MIVDWNPILIGGSLVVVVTTAVALYIGSTIRSHASARREMFWQYFRQGEFGNSEIAKIPIGIRKAVDLTRNAGITIENTPSVNELISLYFAETCSPIDMDKASYHAGMKVFKLVYVSGADYHRFTAQFFDRLISEYQSI